MTGSSSSSHMDRNRPAALAPVLLLLALACGSAGLQGAAPPPAPFGPVPTPRQLAWQQLQVYAFLHFGINTFTDREWGNGDESPRLFNPAAFDADQIAGVLKAAGFRGVILTAKHHDGFCLWPSRTTDRTIARSPYKDGRGDIVREMADACRRAGLKFGIYLSPWDRSRSDYGTAAYLECYRSQLRELLGNYGPVFEVWFDGANGGYGCYGGANQTRRVDKATYYDWPKTWAIVRELQPDAVIFSDGGPDARWIGNERGLAGDPCWATIDAAGFLPGLSDPRRLESGTRFGPQWMPAEADVSIRPGWFFHSAENRAVKTPAELFALYLDSVGRGANLILNVPPDRDGRIAEPDARALLGWKRLMDETFRRDLARDASISASCVRGRNPAFAAGNVADGRSDTYWSTDDGVTTAGLTFDFGAPRSFNLVLLREFLPLGQRIDAVALDQFARGRWEPLASASGIGAEKLLATGTVTTARVRLRITKAAACPALSEVGFYLRGPGGLPAAGPEER